MANRYLQELQQMIDAIFNVVGIVFGVGVTVALCVSMFDDPRRVNGRKRGRHD